jgi:4-amino-4-deoxy-L-arabinose transferase-like glycosyltransferase
MMLKRGKDSCKTADNPMSEVTGDRSNRWWTPALLLVIFAAQSLWFIGTQSFTYDEPGHISAGVDAWQHGRFEIWLDHPPLGRYWLTVPLMRTRGGFAGTLEHVTGIDPSPEWMAWHTRPMNTLLGIALGIVLWLATRRLFSAGAANVALALFAFTPSLIAHFSLATTDGVGALFMFLTAFQLVRWRSNPTRGETVLMGLVLGGLLLAKMYTPPEAVLTLGLMLVAGRDSFLKRPRDWNWKPALATLGVALVIFWAGYQFHISRVKMGGGQILITYPHRTDETLTTHFKAQLKLLLPAGEYAEGLRLVKHSNRDGRATWFMGRVYPNGGPWLYFPTAIVLKWPTVLLLLFSASLLLGVRKTCRSPADLLIISSFGLLFFALALQSRITIGERHLLPLYPFTLLIAGGLWEHARRHRLAIAVLVIGLLLNAADTLRYAPDYLGYFNIFVKPAESWRLLTDSNLDWGQGLIALRSYQRQHPEEVLHLAYFGSVLPQLYGVRAAPLSSDQQVDGTVVVSATRLSGQMDHEGYRWLSRYRPQQVLNHSIWVFDTAVK